MSKPFEFESVPDFAIIGDENLSNIRLFQKTSLLRLSANGEILDNFEYHPFMATFDDSKVNTEECEEIKRNLKNRKGSLGTSPINFIFKLISNKKFEDLQKFFQKCAFPFEIRPFSSMSNSYVQLNIHFCRKNEENSTQLLSDLHFADRIHLVVLLWIFSLTYLWNIQSNCLLILDNLDCLLNPEQIKEVITRLIKELKFHKTVKVKLILSTHRFDVVKSYSNDFYKLNKLNGIFEKVKGQNTHKNNKYCQHGYIKEFDPRRLEDLEIEFNHLRSLKEWRNIPMFSVITGVNAIGKTTLLRFFQKAYPNSILISDLSNPNDLANDLTQYLIQVNNIYNQLVHKRNSKNEISFMDIVKEYPIPLKLKFSVFSHLPLLLELWGKDSINSFLEAKGFKWKIQLPDRIQANVAVTNNLAQIIPIYNICDKLVPSLLQIIFKNQEGNQINYNNFSTGEKLLLTMFLWEFDQLKSSLTSTEPQNVTGIEKKFLLLIDEPDAHLHPSKLKEEIIDFISGTLVNKMRIQVIMTTHNPSTISLIDMSNLFVMYEDSNEHAICVVNAKDSPIHPIILLSSGLSVISQHLVLVESRGYKLFFDEISRQLTVLATHNLSQMSLFSAPLRFMAVETNLTEISKLDKVKEQRDEILDDVLNQLRKELNQLIEKYTESAFPLKKEETEENLKKLLQRRQQKKQLLEKNIENFTRKISELKDYPPEFLDKIKQNLDTWMTSVTVELKKHYDSIYKYFDAKSPTESIVSFVKRANSYIDSDSMSINYTFGIITKNPFIDDKTDYIIYTNRFGVENFIFDPLNLFFFMKREKIESQRSKKVKNKIKKDEKLDKKLREVGIDEDNWNYFNIHFDANKNEILEKYLNLVLQEVQMALYDIDVDNKEIDDSLIKKEEILSVNVKFLQPNVELKYHQRILQEYVESKNIHDLFCDLSFKRCWEGGKDGMNEGKKECPMKNFFSDDSEINNVKICPEKFFNYLKENGFNFLISEKFIQDFRNLSELIKKRKI